MDEDQAMDILMSRCDKDEELTEACCTLIDRLTMNRGMWASVVLEMTGQLA